MEVQLSNTRVIGWRANSDGLDIEEMKAELSGQLDADQSGD
jgi:hypothetical protein